MDVGRELERLGYRLAPKRRRANWRVRRKGGFSLVRNGGEATVYPHSDDLWAYHVRFEGRALPVMDGVGFGTSRAAMAAAWAVFEAAQAEAA